MNSSDIIKELKKHSSKKSIDGMKRFGINGKNMLGGPPIPVIRKMAKSIGKNHKLALKLWTSGIHEARILAGMIDNPKEVTEKQMDFWTANFDSWDLCDQTCMNLFDKTPYAEKKVYEWAEEKREFVRRAGFALIAVLAVHDKNMKDDSFIKFLSLVKSHSRDERNFVKKAVNWALRQIGKRNAKLYAESVNVAKKLMLTNNKTARWIASDALRELEIKKEKICKGR
jgi:3-methyladenine DNA glycosylase AlkD